MTFWNQYTDIVIDFFKNPLLLQWTEMTYFDFSEIADYAIYKVISLKRWLKGKKKQQNNLVFNSPSFLK